MYTLACHCVLAFFRYIILEKTDDTASGMGKYTSSNETSRNISVSVCAVVIMSSNIIIIVRPSGIDLSWSAWHTKLENHQTHTRTRTRWLQNTILSTGRENAFDRHKPLLFTVWRKYTYAHTYIYMYTYRMLHTEQIF